MKLRVFGIRVEAAHAAYKWEQKMGTVLEVDVDIAYRTAEKADRLSRVVPVEEIVAAVHRVSARKTYTVIEAFSNDIIDSIWRRRRAILSEAVVRVRKIRPKSDRRIAGYEVEVRRPM